MFEVNKVRTILGSVKNCQCLVVLCCNELCLDKLMLLMDYASKIMTVKLQSLPCHGWRSCQCQLLSQRLAQTACTGP